MTNESLPIEIGVREWSDGVRYRLPQRTDPGGWLAGPLVVIAGMFWLGAGWLVASLLPRFILAQRALGPWVDAVFLVCGLLVAARGVLKILWGVILIAGHTEIELRRGKLRGIERVGPILRWWTRRAASVRQLVVTRKFQFPGSIVKHTGTDTQTTGGEAIAAILVECDGAEPMIMAFGYRSDWLLAIAHNLAARWDAALFAYEAEPTRRQIVVVDKTVAAAPEGELIIPTAAAGRESVSEGTGPATPDADRPHRPLTDDERRSLDQLVRSFRGISLPLELDAGLQAELVRDERVLWVDQPRPRVRDSLRVALVGIPFMAGIAAWMYFVSEPVVNWATGQAIPKGGMDWFFVIFGIAGLLISLPFLAVGVLLLGAPYWKRLEARKTWYALTDRRIICRAPRLFGHVEITSHRAEDVSVVSRRERADGTGDIVLRLGSADGQMSGPREVQFESIAQVREVERLLRIVCNRA